MDKLPPPHGFKCGELKLIEKTSFGKSKIRTNRLFSLRWKELDYYDCLTMEQKGMFDLNELNAIEIVNGSLVLKWYDRSVKLKDLDGDISVLEQWKFAIGSMRGVDLSCVIEVSENVLILNHYLVEMDREFYLKFNQLVLRFFDACKKDFEGELAEVAFMKDRLSVLREIMKDQDDVLISIVVLSRSLGKVLLDATKRNGSGRRSSGVLLMSSSRSSKGSLKVESPVEIIPDEPTLQEKAIFLIRDLNDKTKDLVEATKVKDQVAYETKKLSFDETSFSLQCLLQNETDFDDDIKTVIETKLNSLTEGYEEIITFLEDTFSAVELNTDQFDDNVNSLQIDALSNQTKFMSVLSKAIQFDFIKKELMDVLQSFNFLDELLNKFSEVKPDSIVPQLLKLTQMLASIPSIIVDSFSVFLENIKSYLTQYETAKSTAENLQNEFDKGNLDGQLGIPTDIFNDAVSGMIHFCETIQVISENLIEKGHRNPVLLTELSMGLKSFFSDINQIKEYMDNFREIQYRNSLSSLLGKNVWEENMGTIVFDENSNVSLATLNQLIIYLTDPDEVGNYEKLFFRDCFLLTYPAFTEIGVIILKLKERYNVPPNMDSVAKPIKLRVINNILQWFRYNWYPIEHQYIHVIEDFFNIIEQDGFTVIAENLRKELQRSLKKQKAGIERSNTLSRHNSIYKNAFFEEYSAEKIAEQLTVMDFEYFTKIHLTEFLNGNWTKENLQHKSRNLLKFIRSFNNFSNWAQQTIVSPESLAKRRRNYTKMIEIAKAFKKLNNFNGLMAIYSALNSTSVYRLKYTTGDLSKKNKEFLSEIDDLLSPSNAYEFRDIVKATLPPLIPFIGIYLTDLIFIDEGNENIVDGMINFTKHSMVYRVICDLKEWQQYTYNIAEDEKIRPSLESLNSISNEEVLYKISLIREPRGANISDIVV